MTDEEWFFQPFFIPALAPAAPESEILVPAPQHSLSVLTVTGRSQKLTPMAQNRTETVSNFDCALRTC
jgi:hypothetical protein